MPDKPDHPHPEQPDQPGAVSFPSIGDNPQFAGADDADLSTLHTRLDESEPDTGQNVFSGDADTDAPTQPLDELPTEAPQTGDPDEAPTVVDTAPPPPVRKAENENDFVSAYIRAGLFAPGDTQAKPLALLAGRYAILKLIGRGGMGVVFLARDKHADCNVAVKTIHPRHLGDADAKQRFIEEAKQMARIPSHASVLVVKDVSDAERPFYTMEFMPRGSLGRLIREQGALDRDTTLRLAQSIAKAIDYVHVSAGAIHRDIKPENVLLAEDGTARLCDFGLIRRVGSGAVGLRAGTLAYMPPEVVSGGGKNVGFEWDIYSMGALLYEMLTGKPPYAEAMGSSSGTGTDRIDALKKAVTDSAPRPILSLNRKADRGLVAIAQWAMARNKRERYVQVADLLADLERVAKNQKPLGPQQSSATANKRKTGVAALLLVLIAAAAYGAYVLFGPEASTSTKDDQKQADTTINVNPTMPRTGNALLDQTNPNAPFTVELKTTSGRNHFTDGEPLRFIAGPADQACYLTVLLYSVGSEDPPVQLYPSQFQPGKQLNAGESIPVPNDQAIANRFQAIVEAPYTSVLVKVIATRQPIRLANLEPDSAQVFVEDDDVKMGATVGDVLKPDQWSTTELLITTGPPGSTGPEK